MKVKVTRQNITQEELIKALAGYIQGERIEEGVIEALQKKEHSHGKEIVPERYIRTINAKLNTTFLLLLSILYKNIDLWFKSVSKNGVFNKLKAPVLTQTQANELREIILAHFLFALGKKPSRDIEKRWRKLKLTKPKEDLSQWTERAYIAGILAEYLHNKNTYSEMMEMANNIELNRQDELLLQSVQENSAKYMMDYGRKLSGIAENVALTQHQAATSYLTQQYFNGELKHPKRIGSDSFTQSEIKALLAATSIMTFAEMAKEIKEQINAEDMANKMKTLTESEIRYATNLGRIMSIQREGGGNAHQIGVYYGVQPGACHYCKEVYLNPDGTPKIFPLSEIINNLEVTGGMNIGLKAKLIGKEGGWVPNILLHPNCRCQIIPYYDE